MGYYIGEIIKLRNKFFEASDKAEFAEALKYGNDIIKLYKDNGDNQSLEYANDVNNLAIIYDSIMSHQKAIELYKEAADIREKLEGDNSLDYADTLSNMAVALSLEGNHSKAFSYHRMALKIREAKLSDDSDDCIMSLYNMGSACEDLGKPDRAIKYYESAIQKADNRGDYPKEDYADIVIGRGRILSKKGYYRKAIEMYEKAIDILDSCLNKKNFFYLSTLMDVAMICEKSRVYDKAACFYEKAIKLRESLLDTNHLDYITNINSLASVYNHINKHDKAAELHKKVVSLIKKLIGNEHPYYADGLNNAANDYLMLGDIDKALEYNSMAEKAKKQVTGTSTPGYAAIVDVSGDICRKMGNFKAAEEKYMTAQLIRKRSLGSEEAYYLKSFNKLAELYIEQKKYSKASECYCEAIKIQNNISDYETLSENLYKLALVMIKMDKNGEALNLMKKSLENSYCANGKLHPIYFRGLYHAAVINRQCKKYEQALNYINEAMKYQLEYLGRNSEYYKETRKEYFESSFDIIEYYFNNGKEQKAIEYYNNVYPKALKEGYVDKYKNCIRFAPLFAHLGNMDKANDMLEEYKKYILEKNGECSAEYALYLKEKGKLLILLGAIEQAEETLIKCLKTEYVIGDTSISSAEEISIELGNAFKLKGNIKKAYSYYEKVFQKPESDMYPMALIGAYDYYVYNGEEQKAKETLLKAKEVMEKKGGFENKTYADITWKLGKIYENEKNFIDAERFYNISVCTRRILNVQSISYINDLIHVGNIMKKNGNKTDAVSVYNEASLEILNVRGENEVYAKLLTKIAKLYVDLGKNDAAENFFKRAAGIYKNMYGDYSDKYAAALYDMILFCVKTGKAVLAAESVQNLMLIAEKNISSRFRNEKYNVKIKNLYDKIQKM